MKAVWLKAAATVLAGLTLMALPVAAQQEVSPDHFDEAPATARPHKPAVSARKTAATRNKQSVAKQLTTAPKGNSGQKSALLSADARSTAR